MSDINLIIDAEDFKKKLKIKDGYTPIEGVDYFIPDPITGPPGESVKGDKGDKGDDGSPDTPEQIREKLEKLKGNNRLDASAIKNLPKGSVKTFGGSIGAIKEIIAGTNISIDHSNLGYPIISTSDTGAVWGSITGTLSDQTDLQTVLDTKIDSIGDAVGSGSSGSVLFVDTSGNLGQDNVNFFWDDSNNRLGIGTSAPSASLHIAHPTAQSLSFFDGYGDSTASGALRLRKARGTLATPTATLSGDTLGILGAVGHSGSAFGTSGTGVIQFLAAENFSATNQGTYLSFLTTPTGSTTAAERFRISADGTVRVLDLSSPNGIVFAGDTGALIQDATIFNWDVSGSRLLIGGTILSNSDTILAATGAAIFNEQANDADFRIESQNKSAMFFVDASTDRIGIGTSTPSTYLHIKNTTAGNVELAIDAFSPGNPQIGLYISGNRIWTFGAEDADDDAFKIGTSSTSTGTVFRIAYSTQAASFPGGALSLGKVGGNTGALKLLGTTSGTITFTTQAAAGTYTLTWPVTAGAENEVLTTDGFGNLSWTAGGAAPPGATIWQTNSNVVNIVQSTDNLTIGSAVNLAKAGIDGDTDEIQFLVQAHSTQTALLSVWENSAGVDQITFSGTGAAVFNEAGNDADFRIESSGNANAIFVDAGNNYLGIGTGTPSASLHIKPADKTGLTVEEIGTLYDVSVAQFTGSVANERYFYFTAPVLSGSGTPTVTSAATVYISGQPTSADPPSNVTISNAYSLWIDAGNTRLDGNLGIGVTTISYPLHVTSASTTGFIERTSSSTNIVRVPLQVKHKTSGDMVDNFGTAIQFLTQDSAAVEQTLGYIGAVRDGADNEGALTFRAGTDGAEEFMRLENDGSVTLTAASWKIGATDSSVSGTSAIAVGITAVASANFASAIGTGTTASGISSTSIGYASTSSADYTTTVGNNTTASSAYATVVGASSSAASQACGVLGYLNTVGTTADFSYVLGGGNTVTNGHSGCVIVGSNATTTAANQLWLGSATSPLSLQQYGSSHWNAAGVDSDFQIEGLNDVYLFYTDASTDRVGIGTVTPAAKLDVNGTIVPSTNDVGGLGTSSLAWADLFLASGAVINFNASNITLTHSAGLLTLAGGQFTFGANTAYFTQTDDGNSGTADTIDWRASNKHKSTVNGNVTYTFTAPGGPCNLILELVHDATATTYTITWPGTVKWPGGTKISNTNTANAVDIVGFYYDGSSYYATGAVNFS